MKSQFRIFLTIVLLGVTMLALGTACFTSCTRDGDSSDETTGFVDTAEASTPESEEGTNDPADSDFEETTVVETVTEAPTGPVEDPALNVFPTEGDNIEIGIFWEPPAEFTTPEQYDWIRDANITFIEVTNWRGEITHELAQKQIELAKERGIKISYNPSHDGKTLVNMSDDEIEAYAKQLAEDPTVVGIHVVDEPSNPWSYARICAAIKKGGLTPRLNFLPYFATWVFENYQGHVEDTIIATGKENYGFLCYDQYPFPYGGGDPDMWYNLDMFRLTGLKYDVETGFYIQSIGEHGNFRRTDGGEIRYHASSALAYGLTSLTYFTWWTTGYCDPADYAIISPYGEKTDIYDDVAEVNADILRCGRLIRRLDALEVYHTDRNGTSIETVGPTDVPMYSKPKGRNGFIISLMEDPETGRDYIMLVNKNYKKEITADFTVSADITHLYNCTNGAYEEMDISGGQVTLTFKPGGFMLFAVGQHDNIVDRIYDKSANLAEGKAPATDYVNPGSGFYAYAVTDGVRDNSSSIALGYRSPKDTGYLEIDLCRVTTVNRIDIYPTGTEFTRGKTFPTAFALEYSTDGENWTTILEKTDYTDCLKGVPTFTFDAIEARYIRLTVKAGCATGGFEIAELEIYNDDGSVPAPDNDTLYKVPGGEKAGTNVALGRGVTASSYVAGWEPSKLTDGTEASGWTSGLNRHGSEEGSSEWLIFDLNYVYTLDKIIMYPRSNDNYFPKEVVIEVSEDGVNFTEVKTVSYPEKREGENPSEVVLDGEVRGRYVRITGRKLRAEPGFNDGHLFSMMECEILNK